MADSVIVKVTENRLVVTKEDKKVRITAPYVDNHYDATFASDAETLAGTEATKAVSPASLASVKDIEGGFASKDYADGKITQTITEDVEDKAPSEGAVYDALALKANASDVNAALALKAPLLSPAFTGVPVAPTAAQGTNTTQLATCAHVFQAMMEGDWA